MLIPSPASHRSAVAAVLVAAILVLPLQGAAGRRESLVHRSVAEAQIDAEVGAEVLWDRFGVPHIFAKDERGLGYAFGWTQMQAHADLILFEYGHARGRAAEYWGTDHEEMDVWVRRLGIPATTGQWYESQEAAFRRYLAAFAEGMNAWATAHKDEISDSLEIVLPLTPQDVIAHGARVITASFVTSPDRVQAAVRAWESGSLGVSGTEETAAGSNAWAIGPKKSASGHAMLVANPHLPWSGFFTWFEAQLSAPNVNIYGATIVGSPVIAIGFNDALGWTHTVNTYDGQDLYELTLDGDGYRWNGARRAFETRLESLSVKGGDGRITKKPLLVRSSVHGPLVAEKPGKALALRVAGLDRPAASKEWWDMGRARNLTEFRAALGEMQIPMFTVMYADRDGHIMNLFGGLVPVRSAGDFAFWQGAIRGDTSALLWTKYHQLDELPVVLDPPTGWLQNANEPPWTATIPYAIDAGQYPLYMAPRGMPFRPQRSAQMLLGDEKLTFDEVVVRKHSTRMALADRLLDDLVLATRERGTDLGKRAADVLASWDRGADADSKGGVLFASWWREYSRRARGRTFATPWNAERPLATPDGLADTAVAVQALEASAGEVQQRYGALDVSWGVAYRFKRDSVDLPANGGSGTLGIFRVVEFANPDPHQPATAQGGDSFVAIVEFSNPVRARALIGYGNASQPGSPHRVDQLPLLARKELRPVWRERKEIEAHLERREKL